MSNSKCYTVRVQGNSQGICGSGCDPAASFHPNLPTGTAGSHTHVLVTDDKGRHGSIIESHGTACPYVQRQPIQFQTSHEASGFQSFSLSGIVPPLPRPTTAGTMTGDPLVGLSSATSITLPHVTSTSTTTFPKRTDSTTLRDRMDPISVIGVRKPSEAVSCSQIMRAKTLKPEERALWQERDGWTITSTCGWTGNDLVSQDLCSINTPYNAHFYQ